MRKINLGSGSKLLPGYVNVDFVRSLDSKEIFM